jgi:xanthine dehydrogenase iron-sulfur cluster and FAD-binding subunit A
MWHTYHSVSTLDEALERLAEGRETARIVAGATDLLLDLERGVRHGITSLIDITRLPGLANITLDDDDWIHLGPLVTHNHCVGSKLIVERARPLAQACWDVGAPQIRNRGTVAGNLITASPANDTITPLMALDAVVTLASTRGQRQVPLAQFYTGVRKTVMAPDEMMVDIAFKALSSHESGMFIKLALRRAQAISVVDIAVIVSFDATAGLDGAAHPVSRARIALGSVAPTIVRAPGAEAYLAGQPLTEAVIARAGELTAAAARPIDDVRGPAAYRQEMIRVTTTRALRALASGQPAGTMPEQPVMLWGGQRGNSPPLQQAIVHGPDTPIHTRINGRPYVIEGANEKTLLRLLREDAHLIGTKEGCAEGECGACTVFLDGAAVMACMVPAPRAHGAELVTIEGLAVNGELHPVQQAFVDEGAVQCGYCIPGILMSGAKLLEERAQPTSWEVQQALTGNLCRCTGYYKIVSAIEKAGRQDDLLKQE